MTAPSDDTRLEPSTTEASAARLVQLAGPRPAAPADAEARVRRAVLGEIRAVSRARRVRRRLLVSGSVLAVAALTLVALRVRPRPEAGPAAPPFAPAAIAIVDRVEGDGVFRFGRDRLAQTLAVGGSLAAGDDIETGPSGRVAVHLGGGTSARFDRGSRARVASATSIELAAGAVYVDSAPEAPGLEVRTPFGLVRDVGTQFETRVERDGLRVRVRSGLVEVHRGARVLPARPGFEVRAGPLGDATRVVPAFGPEWEWTSSLAPAFHVDGKPLSDCLVRLTREQGWTLAYASARLARDASGIVVRGSVEGLSPSDALSVVLSTSGLTSTLHDGQLTVSRATSP